MTSFTVSQNHIIDDFSMSQFPATGQSMTMMSNQNFGSGQHTKELYNQIKNAGSNKSMNTKEETRNALETLESKSGQ